MLVDLEELEAQKFVSDVSMQGDMSKYGLAHPNAVVEVNGKEKRTLLFGNVLAEDPRLMYAKRADQPFIYAIWSRFLADVTVNPLNYKDRVLIQLPKTAKIVGLKITDLETERVIIDKSINPKTTTWSTELKDEPEERRLALLNIIAASKSFKVAQYISSRFEDIKDLPWRYHMEVRVALPGASDEQIQHNDYFFTFRIRANRQMGGSPQANADFSLPQSFIDALFSVTFELEQPELPRNPQALESVNVEAIPKEPSARGPLPGAFLPSDIVKEKK